MSQQIIGLVGPIASGKGTVLKILENKGFFSSSTSDRIREELKKRNLEVTRQNLTSVSNEVREKYGNDILARRTSEIIDKQNNNKIVIDAIRNPDEVKFLKNKYNMKLLAITAPQEKRYELFKKRGTNTNGINTWEEFKTLDDNEIGGKLGQHAQRVSDCMKMADITIENNGSLEDLKAKIENIF